MIELLVVLAIAGIAALLALISWHGFQLRADRAQTRAVIRQAFNRAATEAAARSLPHRLVYDADGPAFVVQRKDGSRYLEVVRLDLPSGASTDLADGDYATFTPPGRIEYDGGIETSFTLRYPGGGSATVSISLVGDVKVVDAP